MNQTTSNSNRTSPVRVSVDFRTPNLLLFMVTSISLWVYAVNAHNPFYFDSGMYWELANRFVRDGHFGILNYDDALRGYLFPLMLYIVQQIANMIHADAQVVFYTFSALFFSLLVVILLPKFFSVVFGWEISFLQRLLFSILIFIFWRGHFLYPLSDFPAFSLVIVGVISLVICFRDHKSPFWLAFISGLGFAAATNIRPIYLVSLLIAGLAWLGFAIIKINRRKAVQLISFVAGICVIFSAQSLINANHFQTFSPTVQARVNGEDLYIWKLFTGLRIQRYESNVGNNYSLPYLQIPDTAYKEFKKAGIITTDNIPGYLNIVIHRPFDIALIYFHHTFNGLDIKFDTPYIQNIFADSRPLSFINYSLLFACLWFLFVAAKKIPTPFAILALLCIVVPVVLVIPTAVEIRYFLPVYVLIYGIASFRIFDPSKLLKRGNFHMQLLPIIQLLLAYSIFITLCFDLSRITFNLVAF